MDDDQPEDQSQKSQQSLRVETMTTQFNPSLRFDSQLLGLIIALVLIFLAVSTHTWGDYSIIITGSILALALLVVFISFPYRIFREER